MGDREDVERKLADLFQQGEGLRRQYQALSSTFALLRAQVDALKANAATVARRRSAEDAGGA